MADIALHGALARPRSRFARITGWLHGLAMQRENTRTYQELDRLDDHMLSDIGLTRDDVTSALELNDQLRTEILRNRSPRIYL